MYMEKLFKCIIYKYLLFNITNDMIKAVKECERIRLEIVYLFVSAMLSEDITV